MYNTVSGSLLVSKPQNTYQSEFWTVQDCSPILGSAYTQKPNLTASSSQYEDQPSNSAHGIPIVHYEYGSCGIREPSRRLSYGSGGGGLKQCKCCQSWTSNAQRMCASCLTRILTPGEQFAAMRQAQLVRCKRIGCPNGASSKNGLCRDCEAKQRMMQNARKTRGSANLNYSYY